MADNPGAQEGGGLHHPCLDYTGKLAGRPAATGFTGPGPVEGTHSISVLSVFFSTVSYLKSYQNYYHEYLYLSKNNIFMSHLIFMGRVLFLVKGLVLIITWFTLI